MPATLVLPVGGVCCSQLATHTYATHPRAHGQGDGVTAQDQEDKVSSIAALFGLLVGGALSSMYDVTMPLYKSTCTNGCLPWADAVKSLSPHLNLTRELRHGSAVRRDALIPPAWTKLSPISRRRTVPLISPPFSWLAACRTHTCGARVLV